MNWAGRSYDCDVLVVGGGLAACMAALEASKRGARVVLVDKGRLGRSGSSPTSGGVPQAAFAHADPRDSKDAHFRDTVIGGDYIPHQPIVRAVVSEITDLITAQRTYEINSKVIQASDDMMGTISQIR